jgi:hypothetical protein
MPSESREERDGDHVREVIDRDLAHLLVKELHVMLARSESREVHPGDRRDEVEVMAAPVPRDVAHDDANLHGCPAFRRLERAQAEAIPSV